MNDHRNDLGQPVGFPVPHWRACPRPPRSSMVGSHCRLDPLDPDLHAEQLYQAYAMDAAPEGWTYMGYGPLNTFEEYHGWLMANCVGDDPFFHIITDLTRTDLMRTEAVGVAVGVASFLRIEPGVGVIEVGHIHYSPQLQRTPAATEAMYLMMRRVFDELGYRRYEWKCDALNAASRRAALRLGFTFEGIFRQATIYKDRNRDTAWYSIIDSEWPMLKQGYEAWLDPANFDVQGQQRDSLAALIGQAGSSESK